jgi:hypothetical protein
LNSSNAGRKGRQLRSRYVVCVSNRGYPASLETRKIYLRLADSDAGKHGLVKVIDESGEDYLYPERYFVSIAVPRAIARTFSTNG